MNKTPIHRSGEADTVPRSMSRRGGAGGSRHGRSALLALALTFGWATVVQGAAPRDDAKSAYQHAVSQFNDLDLDQARSTLETALSRAQGDGLGGDPVLAPLHALRAGIVYSATGDRGQTLAALTDAVRADYNVTLPIELRSQELQSLLDEARSKVDRPSTDAIVHATPGATPGQDVVFEALVNTQVPDNSTVVLYYRKVGSDAEFESTYMDVFGNLATATVPASKHGDSDLEYFFYAFDPSQKDLAHKGDRERPLTLTMGGAGEPGGAGVTGTGSGDGGTKTGDAKPGKTPASASSLPRFFINIGLGTGFGIARGTADYTYQQYTPGSAGSLYGAREQACAIERWQAAGAPLAGDPNEFQSNLAAVQGAGMNVLPTDVGTLAGAYDADYCSARHPVSTGFASAPFHIAPEFGFRIGRAFVLSVYTRLQVVTGAFIETDDPSKDLNSSFAEDVRSPNPEGVRYRVPFTWAVGVKGKYFFGKDERKFRLFAGGFAGGGFTRLRVPMGFSNDRNGNSVPDSQEVPLSGTIDPVTGLIIPETCVPVWPYNAGCAGRTGDPSGPGEMEDALTQAVRTSTPSSDERIDTVTIGPGFVGALFGFHYQLHKNFALFAELGVGVWFPNTSSALFDLSLGPAITF
jgi:hypothetical protein